MRILIYGAGKTGTTAVYYAFKNLLPNHKAFFEPPSLLQLPYDQHSDMLVKSLTVLRHDRLAASFDRYQQKILIVRHPFDRLVSYVLFAPNNGSGFLDDRNLERFLALLRRKLEAPGSVAMREITAMVEQYYPSRAAMHDSVTVLETIAQTYPDFFLLRYEDFVDGRLDALSAYSGLPLTNEPEITGFAKKVARSKSYGDWHKWFLPEDVAYFREIYGSYLDRFGYETEIEEAEPLDLETTIDYSIKVGNQGRQNRWLPAYVPGEVHMTSEGPAYHAARDAFLRGSKIDALRMVDEVIAAGTTIAGFFELKSQILAEAEDFTGAAAALRQAMRLAPEEESFPKRLEALVKKETSLGRRLNALLPKRAKDADPGQLAAAADPARRRRGLGGQPRAGRRTTAASESSRRVLVLGLGYLSGIQRAAAAMRQAERFPTGLEMDFLPLRQARVRPALAADGTALSDMLRAKINRHVVDADLVVSALGGTAHTTLGLAAWETPWDFALDTAPGLLPAPDRPTLPLATVRERLEAQMAGDLNLIGVLAAAIDRPLVQLQPPPPVPNDAHVLTHPGDFGEAAAAHGIAPATLRQKLWLLESALLRQFCEARGIAFLEVPARALDPDGLLLEKAWSDDPARSNAWYGRKVVNQLAGWLSANGRKRAGVA